MICAVIPTLNSAASLPALLTQLRPHVDRIVIADGGSEDDTLQIAAKHDAVIALGAAGRGPQLRRGARWAHESGWLLFLHADSVLPNQWEHTVQHHIKTRPETTGYFDLRFDSPRMSARIIEALVRIRCWMFGLPYGDQGLLISRSLYAAVGGYPGLPLFEDVALIRSLGKKRITRLGLPLITSAEKFERDGFYRRGWRNFRLLRRYLGGEAPADILKDYQ